MPRTADNAAANLFFLRPKKKDKNKQKQQQTEPATPCVCGKLMNYNAVVNTLRAVSLS